MAVSRRVKTIWMALLLGIAANNTHAQLPERVAQAAQAAKIPTEAISLWIAPVNGSGNSALPSFAHNANTATNPASLIKLLTTFAALDSLGPAFSWQTQVLTTQPLRRGVLEGNLILRGSGDPALTWDRLGQLLRELRARGLNEIRGDLLLDRSLLAPQKNDPAFDDEPLRAYNAGPDALLVDFKALQLRLIPDLETQTLRVEPITPLRPLYVSNTTKLALGPCTDWRGPLKADLQPEGDGFGLRLNGTYNIACGERVLNLAAHDGPRLASAIFRQLWQELGGIWLGQAREGIAPPDAIVLASWRSPPLAEVVRSVNKFSNNVMARQLFLSLAAQRPQVPPPISVDNATAELALREWLLSRQILLPELVLENGSGLSRKERITAEGLGRLLQFAWRSPRMPEFVASLPVAGIDGTGQRRFARSTVFGRAYLKSGSLDNVMAIAGYVQDGGGQWQVVVCIINHPRADFGEAALVAAVEQAGR